MKLFALLLSTLALPFLTAHAGEKHKDKPAKFPDISHEELAKAVESKTVAVIDVNGSESFKQGRIPGAIDFEAKKDQLANLLPADKGTLVVAYCGGPMCKAYKEAAKATAALGYTNVKHYSGGISGWKKSGAAVESDPKS